jgi:hypothetical protein
MANWNLFNVFSNEKVWIAVFFGFLFFVKNNSTPYSWEDFQ